MSIEGKSSFALDTSFWEDLWDNYTTTFHDVVIHCWKEEEEIIEELRPKAISILNEGLVKVMTVNLNEENHTYFRNNSIDPKGGLKWFMMFFNKDGDERLEIGHYGSEVILYKVDEVNAEKFVSLFNSSATTHFYDENAD
ncbi:hypothetical protein FG382_10525 [Psychrobacillus lasiicapitis]|uniref:Uncharacterized protein n=2 Tax=Psychrobacillus lasiicapitis TaxID=1636719 RepID=A0A544T9N0_9BACI|nr:hypothetical protein FG382_10525 [Psychrobacillus lasiicapitis]